MGVHKNDGHGSFTDLDTPGASKPVSDRWSRDKQNYSTAILGFFGLLFSALILMLISQLSDMQTRIAHLEAKVDILLDHDRDHRVAGNVP